MADHSGVYGESVVSRFWEKADRSSGDGCWPWVGARNPDGYGSFGIGGRAVGAHRVAWEIENGRIPAGMHILHSCDNPQCVRPSHLSLGTHADNMADCKAKGRGRVPIGENCVRAKLTADQVVEIYTRALSDGQTWEQIAAEFGVARSTVGAIARGANWRHVTGASSYGRRPDRHAGKMLRATPRGEAHGNSKLTTDQVVSIRQRSADGETRAALAREFGVSPTLVSAIVRFKVWAQVQAEVLT